jgi:copper transport protein
MVSAQAPRVPRFAARAALGAVAAVLFVLLTPAAPAAAHAYLARSAPADGAVLDRAPQTLTLGFTEHVEQSATSVDIVDGDGRHWAVTSLAVRPAGGDPVAADTAESDTETPVDVVAGLPPLPPNVYHISWRTLSSDDLHATSGTLVLGVQREVPAAARVPGPGGPGARETALRALALGGGCLLAGGAALVLVMAAVARRGRAAVDPALPRRLLRVAAAGGAVALVAVPAQLVVQVSGGGPGWSRLLWQQAGSARWLLRELGLALLLAVVLGARRGLPAAATRPAVAAGALGAVLAAAGTALLGHPQPGPLSAFVGGLHVLAAGGWAGSVLAAAVALVPVLRHDPDRMPAVRALLRGFAVLAACCLGTLAVTGLLMTGAQVATVDAALITPYGLLLLAKVALVAAAGLLGLSTFRRLRRAGTLPARRLVVEAVTLAAVLVLAGALGASGPAKGPRFPTARTLAVPQVSGQVADLVDTVSVRPNRPGRNIVSVAVDDTRRPAPAPVTGVSLMLRGPDGTQAVYPVTRGPDGWTVAVDAIRSPGDWTVSVTVLRDGLAPATDAHRWPVPPATDDSGTVLLSSAPLQPAIGWLALLLALGLAAAAGWYGYRARRRRRPSPPPQSTMDPGGTGRAEGSSRVRIAKKDSAAALS